MRLLNTSTLEVQEFLESRVPEYVILSHTWRDEEVTLQDLLSGKATTKKGYAKLTGCCKKAKDDGFAYCWIDTCCIDKTSSAELSEAINSMYQWYKNAEICYAYLEDVNETPESGSFPMFHQSKWFTRGWTLQELIAPPIVEFYDASWSELGTRSSLQYSLTRITGINRNVLTGGNPLDYAVAVRLSWAARRETSRLEDKAYCLFGILGVNMPLLYGEGKRAFRRLQEEILRVDEDYTLFAWDVNPGTLCSWGYTATESLLASSPSDFQTFEPVFDPTSRELSGESELIPRRENLSKNCFSVLPPPEDHSPPQITSRGCRLSLPLFRHEERSWYGCLACLDRPSFDTLLLCIMLRQDKSNEYRFERDWDTSGEQSVLICLPLNTLKDFRYASIYVTTSMDEHRHLYAASVQGKGHSVVQIVLDPELRSEISHEPSDRHKALVLEEAFSTEVVCPPPEIWDYYGGEQNDTFRFRFVYSGGLDLRVVVSVHASHNPWFTAEIGPSIKSPDVPPVPLFPPPPLPKAQPTPDRSLDRETFRFQDPTDGKDPGWAIRVSIRRAGPAHSFPKTKMYVLTLTKV